MDQLRFTGLHEDGAHLVVTAGDGTDYVVPVDDRLRAAVRERPRPTSTVPVTPREVQSMIRAGHTPEEIAGRTGWDPERVQRYETPILAEREHVARRARAAHVRTHDRAGSPPTLESRASERLEARGVPADKVAWDATRPEGGRWTVVVTFVAGQRDRQASWTFDPATGSLDALDDEARWLSEDEVTLPRDAAAATIFGGSLDGPDDLMSSMRERSRKRGRTRRPRPGAAPVEPPPEPPTIESDDTSEITSDPGSVPGRRDVPEEALPLEDFPYDPDTMGLPPSAHGHTDEEESEEVHEATLADFFDQFDGEDDDEGEDEDLPEDEAGPLQEPYDEAGPAEEAYDEALPEGEDVWDDEGGAAEEGPPEGVPSHRGDTGPAPTPESEDAGVVDPAARRRGRPSVPSWDDIMFGARDRRR
jgi:hypothetical protein